MATDNRTLLNNCGATTGWTGDDNTTVITDTGLFYEGSSSLATQLSDSDEHMYTTNQSGVGTFSIDMSDVTLYMIIKDNLVNTQANGGTKFVIGDGTDRVGYEIGGYDNVGIPLPRNFNGYRLDVSNRAAFTFFTFAGSEANLTVTAITQVGYGSLHLSKASGAIDNVFMDAFRYIANGTPALTINAGTSGTPITLATLAANDLTNGWGMISSPLTGQYIIAAPAEFGTTVSDTDAYFSQSNAQIYLDGRGIGTDNFNFRVIGATGTGNQSFELINCVVVNIGVRANWTLNGANHDLINLSSTQFINNGTFLFPIDAAGKSMTGGGFTNCDQIYFDDFTADGVTINGSNDATGAILWDEGSDSSNQSNFTLVSDGTGHGVYVNPTGSGPFSYTITGWTVSNYETDNDTATGNTVFLCNNNTDADITINVATGTGSFSYERQSGYTGTVTINSNASISITVQDGDTNPIANAIVAIYDSLDDSEIFNDSTSGSGTISSSAQVGTNVYIRVRKSSPGVQRYIPFSTVASVGGGGLTLIVTLIEDEVAEV